MYKYILGIFLIIIIIFLYNNQKQEHYNLLTTNIDNIDKCADIASSIYGIAGFAYNPQNQNCYLSKKLVIQPKDLTKSSIVGMDLLIDDSLSAFNLPYYGLSNQKDIICNKRLPILNQKDITNDTIIENRIYECDFNKFNKKFDANITMYFEKNKPGKELKLQHIYQLPFTYHNMFYIDTNDIVRPSELRKLNVKFDQQHTTRTEFGEKIINDSADNLFISLA